MVEASGAGHIPSTTDILKGLAGEIPIFLASHAGSREVLQGTYSPADSETDLLSRGLANAGILDGPKARLLLCLLLRAGASKGDITGAFEGWYGG